MVSSIERKLVNAVEGIIKHIKENRYQFYRTIFTTSDDVCWELVYYDYNSYGDLRSTNIVVYKWTDGEPVRLVEFCTDYCFDDWEANEEALGSTGQRLLDFLVNEV
jgi:hypothetical protein